MREVKKDTNRIAKVNSLIKHELGPVLLEYLNSQEGFVTITKVDTSKDMKWAKVWISIFYPKIKGQSGLLPTDEENPAIRALDDKMLKFLASNIYEIQGELNKHFFTKIIPRISFHLDTSPRYVQHIDEVLRKIHDEDR